MILPLLLALLPQSQAIRIERPPATPFVVHASVPHELPPLRSSAGYPSSSRHVLSLMDKTDVSEVSVLVPGGTTSVELEGGADNGPSLVAPMLGWLARRGRAVLWIDGHRFSLSNPAHFVGWHRNGRVHATATMHRTLGAYGAAEWWWDVRADGGIDMELLWHRATPGSDVRFTSARLVVAGGVWSPVVVPPACASPYLVRPRADGTRHVIPQEMGMAWWIHVAGPTEHVGIGDWSRGGYLPSGFPVAADTPREPYAARTAQARSLLASNSPSPSWGTVPTSPLWPASGTRTGGEGGGDGRWPLDGVQWAASSGDPDALDFYRIELLRGLSRARIRLEPDGSPLVLAGLPRTWAFDIDFLPKYGEPGGKADAPWEWDSWPWSWAGDADPRNFSDHDTASMVRRLRTAWVLSWLAYDPLARLLTLEGATRAELTCAPLGVVPFQQGTDAGAREAQCALAIAAARCLGASQYEGWISAYLGHMRGAQMQSGCFTARLGGYPSELPPFDAYPDIRLQGGEEFALTQLALYSLGERTAVRKAARGMVALATDDDDAGFYYFAPTGIGAKRFFSDDQWPPALFAQMGVVGSEGYYTAQAVGYATAIAWAVQAPERFELLRRFTGSSDPATARSIMLGWGTVAPSGVTSAPVENYWPVYGQLP